MTVSELIERLRDMPPGARVFVSGRTHWHEVYVVKGNFCEPGAVTSSIDYAFVGGEPDAKRTEVMVEISAF